MSQTLSTLIDLAIYLGLVALGALLGSRRFFRARPMRWLGALQTVALMILIVSLGVQLGANEEVITSLGTIGLTALAVTVAAMLGSLLCVWLLRRFVFRLDRQGRSRDEAASAGEEHGAGGKANNRLTWLIVGAVAVGMAAGYFLLPPAVTNHCGQVIQFGLYLLLFLVGLDMGKQGTMLRDIRAAGPRVLLVPLAVLIGTLGAGALVGLLLPIGAKDAAAAVAGFGWYSLAPSLLAPYSLTVSAVSFLSNVIREIFAILFIPVVARRIGYVECVSLPGAAAMDTVLPVVVGATNERVTIYSFASGVVLSLLVPLLVPAIAAIPV